MPKVHRITVNNKCPANFMFKIKGMTINNVESNDVTNHRGITALP